MAFQLCTGDLPFKGEKSSLIKESIINNEVKFPENIEITPDRYSHLQKEVSKKDIPPKSNEHFSPAVRKAAQDMIKGIDTIADAYLQNQDNDNNIIDAVKISSARIKQKAEEIKKGINPKSSISDRKQLEDYVRRLETIISSNGEGLQSFLNNEFKTYFNFYKDATQRQIEDAKNFLGLN